jgi:hypothetical protein
VDTDENELCDICGKNRHTHTYGEWVGDETNHWKECTCGEKTEVTAHTANADDGDCTTAVTCQHCDQIMTAAKTHVFTGEWSKDADGHWHVCANNGCKATDTKVGHTSGGAATETTAEICTECQYVIAPALGHTCTVGEKQTGKEATCTTPGWKDYYKCSGCDKTYTDEACTDEITDLEASKASEGKLTADHTYGEWISDETNHWKECTCGEKTEQGAHTDSDGNNKCDACDKTMISEPSHTHTYGEWVSDGTNHWKECSCGEKADSAAHGGGTATCTAKAKCSVCNAEYGDLAEHKYSEATCTAKAKCSVCGNETGDLAEHKYSEATCTAKAKCSVCGNETGDLADHKDTDTNGKCDACGIQLTEDPEQTTGTTKPNDPQTPQEPGDGSSAGVVVVIVIVAVAALGGGGFCLYWFVIRKKLAVTAPAAPADVDPASDSENEEKTE